MIPDMRNMKWIESNLSLPPVTIRVLDGELLVGESRADAILEASWNSQCVRFAAEIKARSIPKLLREAIAQSRSIASPPDTYPMVIMPYLSEEKLLELEAEGVSGMDLCGNGVLVVPGRLWVFRSGGTNRFKESAKPRNAYRGMNSLVARAFLIQPRFSKVKEIEELLRQRGKGVVMSTVSKVLQRLEDDLIVARSEEGIRLTQPDTLLDNLSSNYEAPREQVEFRGKCSLPIKEAARRLSEAATARGKKLVLTGAACVERYAVAAGAPMLSVYTTMDVDALLESSGIDPSETSRFVNLEITQTRDERVFTDIRPKDGVPYASPVQAYLELSNGDKRQQDAAQQVRRGILKSLEDAGQERRTP
jgi:hypothetical protein